MMNKVDFLLPIVLGSLISLPAILSLMWWMEYTPQTLNDIVLSKPGLDNIPKGVRNKSTRVAIGEFFERFATLDNTDLLGEWPRFRGADFSNICRDGIKLADAWPSSGPRVLWRQTLDEGHAAPVIYRGRVFLLDYLEAERADCLRCFSLTTGKELWRRWYKVDVKRNHGRSRTVPATNGKHVITIGPKGHVMCVAANSGDLRWGLDLVADYQATIPQWYTGQCPLLNGDTVVLAPGGVSVLMLGVDAMSGAVKWTTPNPNGWKMSHASIMPMHYNGRNMYVYTAIGGVTAVAADGEQTGKILWQTNDWSASVIAPSPVILDNGWIYLTAGYGAGSTMFKIKAQGKNFVVIPGKKYRSRQALALEQQTAIYYREHLFGIMPKDAGSKRMQFVGCRPDDITDFVYQDSSIRFGLGPFIVADNKFYILDDDGTLTMLKPTGKTFKILGRHRILHGHDAWGPIAIADGLMLLRDSTSMVCIEVK